MRAIPSVPASWVPGRWISGAGHWMSGAGRWTAISISMRSGARKNHVLTGNPGHSSVRPSVRPSV